MFQGLSVYLTGLFTPGLLFLLFGSAMVRGVEKRSAGRSGVLVCIDFRCVASRCVVRRGVGKRAQWGFKRGRREDPCFLAGEAGTD